MSTETLVSKFKALPPSAQEQVETFIEFLAKRSAAKAKATIEPGFKFTWEDGLESLKGQFTAVELQHQINELR